MKLFMLGGNKYTCFELPQKIEDSYLIPYKLPNATTNNIITVESNNDRWILKSNGSVDIIEQGMIIPEKELVDYGIYRLKVLGQKKKC